ncbi:RING finger protein 222 [Gastrophryne carolinensis]
MSEEMGSKEAPANECPVCYERLQNPSVSERRLSCGHSFCHDCLVKYLMAAKTEGAINKNIICPLCRYVTFLSTRGLVSPPKAGELNHILEVPITPSSLRHSSALGSTNTLIIPIPESRGHLEFSSCVCFEDTNLETLRRSCDSQVFVISDQGQPMDEDTNSSSSQTHVDARVNCCTSPSIIMVLLIIFLVAVLAAVLPWILLVKKT